MTNIPARSWRRCQRRKADLTEMRPSGIGKTRITFSAPSRGLIGYHGEFLSTRAGTGIMNRLFEEIRRSTRARSKAGSTAC